MTTQVTTTETNIQQPKKKFKLKMPSALAIIIGVVVFVTMLSWIPHAAGKADAITVDGVTYAAGSLGAWQNWIIWNDNGGQAVLGDFNSDAWFTLVTPEAAAETAANYGLDGYWAETGGFVTETSMPWTMAGYADGSSAMFGLLDVPKALLGGYFNAMDVAFYLIGIYAIVLLLMETETLKNGVGSLVKGLGNREILLVPILFVLFSLGGTLFGMQEETLGLLPIIVPVLIIAGFDGVTGMLVAVLGTTTGIAASVLDPFSVGVMAAGLGTGIGTAIAERMILFCVYTTIGAVFVTWYGSRVRKNEEKSADVDSLESNKVWANEHIGDINELDTMSGKQKGAMWIFAIVFGWMVFSLMPWTTWFPELGSAQIWVTFSSLFYGHVLLGEWYFVELGILFLLAAFAIAKIFNMSGSKFWGTVWLSAKDMFGVITIISFSRATASILSTTGLTYGMIYSVVNIDKMSSGDVNPIIFAIVWLFIFTGMAFFIPSTSGLAGVTAPLAGGVIGTVGDPHSKALMTVGILMVYPLAQGCVNMFSPTTGLVVVQAEQSKVSYGKVLPLLAGYAATIFVVGIICTALILGGEMAVGLYPEGIEGLMMA